MADQVQESGVVLVDAERLLIDVRYAIRQLEQHECIDRALDALERVRELLRDAIGSARG